MQSQLIAIVTVALGFKVLCDFALFAAVVVVGLMFLGGDVRVSEVVCVTRTVRLPMCGWHLAWRPTTLRVTLRVAGDAER